MKCPANCTCGRHKKRTNENELPMIVESKLIWVGDCLLWQGNIDAHGYGVLYLGLGETMKVHRYVWQRKVGAIPPGMTIDHVAERCNNKNCCNVEHMEVVTQPENARRYQVAKWKRTGGTRTFGLKKERV